MNEDRFMTDLQLEHSIQNQISQSKANKLLEESNNLELMKKFNLTYINADSIWVSVESENFSANISKHSSTGSNIKMLCKLDIKDISTFDEFQKARDIVMKEKQKTLTGLYWIAFRAFQDKI